ncbi:hypothetical protein ACFVT1_31060 [Streptomyces sp. NPDC057963]
MTSFQICGQGTALRFFTGDLPGEGITARGDGGEGQALGARRS